MQFGVFSLFDFFPDRQDEVSYYRDSLDLMICAEKLGFDSAWAGEEHFYSFGICPNPQLFLTALARETSRIRLGTAISIMSLENPLRKAEDFAMLDILSNGRLNFGAGKGGYPKHFEGFRIPFEENRARYEEALEIIQHAWTHESFSYDGTFWQIPELSLSPKPIQQPCPPIYRGMASPEAFEVGGTKGHQGLFVPWLTPGLKHGVEKYRAARRAHGYGADASVFVYFLFVDTNADQAWTAAREATRNYTEQVKSAFPPMIAQLPRTDPRRVFWERLDSLPHTLEERAIVGTPRDCRKRIADLHEELGIEHMAFYLHAGARDMTSARRNLELFASEVMPEFR